MSKEFNSFSRGLKDGIPIFLGYLSVSFAFGIYTVQSGLTSLEALLISMTNLTSAGQLAAVPIISGGGSLIELAVSQLVINLRYSLMSISLSQKLGKSIKLYDRLLISFGVTDEIFAVAISRYGIIGKKYMYGLQLMPYIGWVVGTFIGASAGQILPDIVISALGIAIYGMFIAIVVPGTKKSKSTGLCVLLSVFFSCLFFYAPVLKDIPSGFTIIICSVAASSLFALISPVKTTEMDLEEKKI